jgi:hypothetical protein
MNRYYASELAGHAAIQQFWGTREKNARLSYSSAD